VRNVMNTTPSTFNGQPFDKAPDNAASYVLPSYTVLGGKPSADNSGLSALVLNRGIRYPRRAFFAELEKAGFDSVLSVEGPGEHYDIDELSESFPFIRFITLSAPVSAGEAVNIGAAELPGPLFFVLRSDLKIPGSAVRMCERLLPGREGRPDDAGTGGGGRVCTVPVFQNSRCETLPTAISPVMLKKKLELARLAPEKENTPTLYPYDAVGIYDRRRFLDMGGFDAGIKSEYWQMLDFGFRVWLSGGEIRVTRLVSLRCEGGETPVDAGYNEDYWRFFFKNLAPALKHNRETDTAYAHLPLKYLLPFLLKAKWNLPAAARLFFSARKWVRSRRAAWKISAKELILTWAA